jgi:hypothetical protein
MMFPPIFAKVHIVENGKNKIRLWFPIILVWLLILVFMILLAPLVLIAALILWPWSWGKKLLMFGPMLFYLFSSLKGLDIQVKDSDNLVLISF